MNTTPSIRPFDRTDWRTYRDLRLRALEESPDAFGSTLRAEQERSDAQWKERLGSGVHSPLALPLFAEVDSRPAGLAWGKIEPSEPKVAHLYQMWVAPESRRFGIGRMLLETIISWAESTSARHLFLSVTLGNTPAHRLYSDLGFEPTGEQEPLRPGAKIFMQTMVREFGSGTNFR